VSFRGKITFVMKIDFLRPSFLCFNVFVKNAKQICLNMLCERSNLHLSTTFNIYTVKIIARLVEKIRYCGCLKSTLKVDFYQPKRSIKKTACLILRCTPVI